MSLAHVLSLYHFDSEITHSNTAGKTEENHSVSSGKSEAPSGSPATFVPEFKTEHYSMFKYGCVDAAELYGEALAQLFLSTPALAPWVLSSSTSSPPPTLITCSPFKFVPTASASLLKAFADSLKQKTNSNSLENSQRFETFKVDVGTIVEGDYGTLTEEQRRLRINGLNIHLPNDEGRLTEEEQYSNIQFDTKVTNAERIQGRRVIVMDDIRVTGSHEARLHRFFEKHGAAEICFLYIVVVTDNKNELQLEKQTESMKGSSSGCCSSSSSSQTSSLYLTFDQKQASFTCKNPVIEDWFNHQYIKSLDHLSQIIFRKWPASIMNPGVSQGVYDAAMFRVNARICKYLCSYKDVHKLEQFYQALPLELLQKLKEGFVKDGLWTMPTYRQSCETLEQVMTQQQQ